jgi:hypothetical protein
MTRLDPPILKPATVVSRADYEADRLRGYCILEFRPAGIEVLTDRMNPGKEIRRPVSQILLFRCMRCQFDCVDSAYTKDRTGLDIMKLHLFHGEHPWSYTPFKNPYGNIADVVIEGIEDYSLVKGD